MTGMKNKKRLNPFVQIDKELLADSKVSWKAKGILAYLLSKPDEWITYVADLEKQSTDGRDSVRAGINELESVGYIKKKKIRVKGMFKGWEYEVYESPHLNITEDGKSDFGETDVGKTDVGKSNTSNNDLSNKELSNNDLSNINNNNASEKVPETPFSFYEQNGFGMLTPHVGEKIGVWIDDLNEELVIHALKMTVESGVLRWKYAEAILKDWHNKKFTSLANVLAAEKKREQENIVAGKRNYRPAREEQTPDWLKKDKQDKEDNATSERSKEEIDAERAALLKELNG